MGEIWVNGPSIAQGYWGQPEQTDQVFRARLHVPDQSLYLRTGDLGFFHQGELYVTGRLKDLIIIRGCNHHPEDIEATVARCHPALQPGCGAAFSVDSADDENLVIVHEVGRSHRRNLPADEIAGAIGRGVLEHHGLHVHDIVLIKPATMPKTSSGKIRRHACRSDYLERRLEVVARLRRDWANRPAPTDGEDRPSAIPTQSGRTAEQVQAWLVDGVSRHAHLRVQSIDASRSFADYGLDSASSIGLLGELECWLGRRLSPTLLYQYPTIASLGRHLADGPECSGRPSTSLSRGDDADAVAIIGIGCRFPGAEGPEAYLDLLCDGVDAITRRSSELGDGRRGRESEGTPSGPSAPVWGGFLEQVDQFDAHFFGIPQPEASCIDPQQRLLLEVAWEALEDAAHSPALISGSRTGVFLGISTHDYYHLLLSRGRRLDGYFATGGSNSIAANRLSYQFNLRGPSVAIDTACSSSLVAVHMACESLCGGECDMALAGGVNLILSGELTQALSQAGMMAADGRCKPFDSRADGYVRGEGCGVVVLRRLSDAVRDGDRILALVCGSAVNQDGRTNGLTAPNGLAQQEVVRTALHRAGLNSSHLDYLEAHGTGTYLGDPVEVDALKAVLGENAPDGRRACPCILGSVKANIGHLEAAAGIAGLIKVVLMLWHGVIPPHINFNELNPHISLAGAPLHISQKRRHWPRNEARRYAGVSAFGFGGTNAHVILADAPQLAPRDRPLGPTSHLLVLSARNDEALGDLARRYAAFLAVRSDLDLADVCFTASTGRSHFESRLAIVADSTEQLRERVGMAASERQGPASIRGQARRGHRPKIAFLFSGQSPLCPRLVRWLSDAEPVFRRALDRCDEVLRQHLERPLRSVLDPTSNPSPWLRQPAYAQPALFALQFALTELWSSWGVVPDAVMGHSAGEYMAACAAGVFGVEEGLEIIAKRGRLVQDLPEGGSMVALLADLSQVRAAIAAALPDPEQVSIAALNGPSEVVISGPDREVGLVLNLLCGEGVVGRYLEVTHSFHSPAVAPAAASLEAFLVALTPRSPAIPMVSTLLGRFIDPGETLDARHWRRHLVEPVRFSSGMQALAERGFDVFVEIGPGRTLLNLGRRSLGDGDALIWAASLEGDQDGWPALLDAVGKLFVRGAELDWRNFRTGLAPGRVALPTYPFQRRRYWVGTKSDHGSRPVTEAAPDPGPAAGLVATVERRHVSAELRRLIANYLQVEADAIDPRAPILEMGADSLVLIRAVRSIEDLFHVKVPIRRIIEDLRTIDALASYIAGLIPAGSEVEDDQQPAALDEDRRDPGVRGQDHADSTTAALERVITQQLRVMEQQLAVLRSGARPEPRATKSTAAPAGPREFGPYRPIRATPEGHLGARQREHLSRLVARYTERTATSRRLAQEYRHVLADSRASAGFRPSIKEMLYPIIAGRTQGSRLWDADSNEYIDISMDFGVNLLGHRPPVVLDALAKQLEEGLALGPQPRQAGEVASLISRLTGVERVAFCQSGTEAVMTALRLARQATGRSKVVLFRGSYHGHFDGVLAREVEGDRRGQALPAAPGILPAMVNDILVLEYGEPGTLDVIREEGAKLAAVLVEPVQSRRPDLQPRDHLAGLRKVTEERGIALILDEMVTGFRIHPGGAQSHFGIAADLVTYGKVIGGGMPVAAVAGKAEYLDGIDGGFWRYGDDSYPRAETTVFAGTFTKSPMGMAAARAVLGHLEEQGPGLQGRINDLTSMLAGELNDGFARDDVPIRVVHFGSLFRFAFAGNMDLLFYHMLEKGIYVWEGRNCFLSAAHTETDVRHIIRVVQESVEELRAGGFLPPLPRGTAGGGAAPSLDRGGSAEIGTGRKPERHHHALTAAQASLWFLSRMEEQASCACNISITLRMRGRLDPEALRSAVERVVDRHEALRTRYSAKGDRRNICPKLAIELSMFDLTGLPDSAREDAARQRVDTLSRTCFDLENGPMLRPCLVRLGEQEHWLVLSSHHIAIDGWSIQLVAHEIGTIYSALYRGTEPDLAPPIPFDEFARRESEELDGPRMSEARNYWLGRFAQPAMTPDLADRRPHPAVRTYGGDVKSDCIDRKLWEDLKRLGSRLGSTPYMVLLTCHYVLLHYLAGRTDLIVGIPASGQLAMGYETMVGYCLRILPLRIQISGEGTFSGLLSDVRGELLDANEQQIYPLAHLIRDLKIPHDPGRPTLVTNVFNFDQAGSAPHFDCLEVEVITNHTGATAWEFAWNLTDTANMLIIDCEYNTDLFQPKTILRWIEHYKAILTQVTTRPDITVRSLVEKLARDDHRRELLERSSIEEINALSLGTTQRKPINFA